MRLTCRYPRSALTADSARAATGFALTGGPLVAADISAVPVLILTVLACTFGLYGLATVRKGRQRVEVTPDAIMALPDGARLSWSGLDDVRLAYYSVRRDGAAGWMELRLGGAGQRLRVDSRLEGFREVARCAAAHAQRRGIELDPTTVTNFAALGVEIGRVEGSRPEHAGAR